MPFERMPGEDLEVTNYDQRVLAVPEMAPQTVLRTDQAWQIHVFWYVIGQSAPLIYGTWYVGGYLEPLGKGDKVEIPENSTPMAGPGEYTVVLSVSAGTVQLAPGEQSKLFKLVTTLTAKDESGHPYPMWGYLEYSILVLSGAVARL